MEQLIDVEATSSRDVCTLLPWQTDEVHEKGQSKSKTKAQNWQQ